MWEFYKNKRVFVTGHTGFKGSWMCHVLANAGAQVTGYSLAPEGNPDSLYTLAKLDGRLNSVIADIRDMETLQLTYRQARPEIVFHLAAQPLVLKSYEEPYYTYLVNTMGTLNLLETVRNFPSAISVLNVTTDKVYMNNDDGRAFEEADPLGGLDPYANSKSCSELITQCYARNYFSTAELPVSTVRAGNVIGGGDFSANRIVPDCVRFALEKKPIEVRNPNSIRPYQHVLEPIFAYLHIAQAQVENPRLAGYYNIGPQEADCITTGELAKIFCEEWGESASWCAQEKDARHEAKFLKLNCERAQKTFGWGSGWGVRDAIRQTVRWTKAWQEGLSVGDEMTREAEEYACVSKLN